ncbi:MAG TPA: M1 family aminopeptidase [Terriglobales bacterium]|nr:M1 family aminopeptidase [Terriglobales bacterium]
MLRLTLTRIALLLLFCLIPCLALAETISGTVLDPSGAVITGARIEITGGDLSQAVVLVSDGLGKFTSAELKAGTYSLRVMRDGFETQVKTVDLHGAVQLEIRLAIAQQEVSVNVTGRNLAFANSDPLYRKLREVGLGQTYRLDNFTLTCDVATFQFVRGTLTIVNPVEGVESGAVFVGEGHFSLKPVLAVDAHELTRRTGSGEASEDFTEVVFRFTRDGWAQFKPGIGEQTAMPAEAAVAMNHWREKMRQRRERPLGFTEMILTGETMDNVDADLLSAFYNPAHPEFVNAYMRGKKHKDLRFFMRVRVGALPQLDSPEEVALINYDPEGMDDGVWYLAHLKSEYEKHIANSREDRRLFATRHYKIETVISKNQHLYSIATITFAPLVPGERVLKFGLLPNLRVTRVADDQGQPLSWIQESRKEDGSFYAILPRAPQAGTEESITVEYTGDKVLEQAGEGSFYVRARSSWYPNLNGFGERATYDLTFKVPRHFKVVSVGKLQSESTEQDFSVSHWTTPLPVTVAGFNYGDYTRMEMADDITHYKVSGYYITELPDSLRRFKNGPLGAMAPGAMTKYALEQARSQMQLCTYYFGRSPYEDIYITEQPDFNFGQSWPDLVYLPISAYMDSTQRWMLFGHIDNNFTGFVREVTPHEVAHQWWGHTVMWASYHDQWLSEGFAEFSAGLFLQQAMGKNWHKDYIDFWDRLRLRIIEKNNFGVAPTDAGPIWMGLRLISPKSQSAYQNVTYPKGAYVLAMLRSMMYTPEDQDKDFIAMMHDFVDAHREQPASTESFKAIAEKHMTKLMDLRKNGRLDWFFDEWVYGTAIPRYHFDYQVSPEASGKAKVHMTITQSDVDEHFAMLVPIFADFGNGMVPIAQAGIGGNTTRTFDIELARQPKKVALNAYKEILER